MQHIYNFIMIAIVLAACFSMPKPVFSASDNKAKPEPAWGEASDGFVVSLTLDEDSYDVNANVVAHFSCSRLTADWEKTEIASHLEPCRPEVEVKDSSGVPVRFEDQPNPKIGPGKSCGWWMGSGPSATLHFEKGEVVTSELILNKECVHDASNNGVEGYFPAHPGAYTATAVWEVYDDSGAKVIATARSRPVTFRITGN